MTAKVHHLWDASFPCLRLNGSGTRQFLHGQTSADILKASTEHLIRACWLTATGRVQALLEIQLDAQGADVLVLWGDVEALHAGFDRVIFPADRVKLAAPGSRQRLQRLRQAPEPPQWGEDVIWLDETAHANASLPEEWRSQKTATAEQLEQWRLSQGLPFSGNEINGETNPLELGLVTWLSLDKGCYLGQETVAKLASRDGVKQKLRCWHLASTPTPGSPLAPGMTLVADNTRAGMITSASHTPSGWQGLALIRKQSLDRTSLEVENHQAQITLSAPPAFEDLDAG